MKSQRDVPLKIAVSRRVTLPVPHKNRFLYATKPVNLLVSGILVSLKAKELKWVRSVSEWVESI